MPAIVAPYAYDLRWMHGRQNPGLIEWNGSDAARGNALGIIGLAGRIEEQVGNCIAARHGLDESIFLATIKFKPTESH